MTPQYFIKSYDPLDEAIQLFREFNEKPEERQYSEDQLTQLIVHRITRHDSYSA